MASPNRHEQAARQLKTYRLVAEIERIAEGVSPAARVYWAEQATDEQWASLAILAGCKPPSATTRALVVEALERRAVAA